MKGIRLFTSLLLLSLGMMMASATLHPFYVSISQIDHNPESQALEISVRLFTNDFERVLQEMTTEKVKLEDKASWENADSMIEMYLQKKFEISLNGEEANRNYRYLGREIEEDVTWCYIEVTEVPKLESIQLHNSLFTETLDGQRNIVHVKAHDNEKSLILDKKKPNGTLNF